MSRTLSPPSTYTVPTSASSLQAGRTPSYTYRFTSHTSLRDSSNPPAHASRKLWQYDGVLSGSVNHSVPTSLSLTRSNESSAEPRVAVSDNDCAAKFYDVNVRGTKGIDGPPKRISDAGTLRLDVPVNHCASSHRANPTQLRAWPPSDVVLGIALCPASISPDSRALLSVGDSPHVYLHGMTGGARFTFTPLAQLTLLPFDSPSNLHPSHGGGALPASFYTTSSPSGSKFAIASQKGMLAVLGVRSRKPMKVFTTARSWRYGEEREQGDGRRQWVVVRGLMGLADART